MDLSVATSGSVDWGWYEEIVENVLVAKMHFDCKQYEACIAISQILSKGPNTINKTSLAFRISVLRDKDFMSIPKPLLLRYYFFYFFQLRKQG